MRPIMSRAVSRVVGVAEDVYANQSCMKWFEGRRRLEEIFQAILASCTGINVGLVQVDQGYHSFGEPRNAHAPDIPIKFKRDYVIFVDAHYQRRAVLGDIFGFYERVLVRFERSNNLAIPFAIWSAENFIAEISVTLDESIRPMRASIANGDYGKSLLANDTPDSRARRELQ